MATRSRSALKNAFIKGAKPSQNDFSDWLDSYRHNTDPLIPALAADAAANDADIWYNTTTEQFRGKRAGASQDFLMGNDAILNQDAVVQNARMQINGLASAGGLMIPGAGQAGPPWTYGHNSLYIGTGATATIIGAGGPTTNPSRFEIWTYNETQDGKGAVYWRVRDNSRPATSTPCFILELDNNGTGWEPGRELMRLQNISLFAQANGFGANPRMVVQGDLELYSLWDQPEGGSIKTRQPSVNGAAKWRLGKLVTGPTVTVQTNQFVEVMIDDTIVKLAVVN